MTTFIATFTYNGGEAALAALRPARHTYFRELERQGVLLASGQLVDAPFGDGLLVLSADNAAHARALLADDPFARAGRVTSLDLAVWRPSVGS